ncbi:BTAD domain-containing putative transcriptional regulator [Streptomyces sp. SP17BM10]|uniref:AfsR/SARP family transcriptional regulator n=1 Tax=Streptomyces sp. SP17BM10 TaxID=3002530 RepID=UPI002E76A309|nr:BTAD domain-containing putative transcriptional regulator [Streptomyces sp. SP17BM10]MEE1785659.1 BTAD domain-containing putative transcriptional regulator [Streptomyces sp. SP17BM10]
MDFTLLGPVSAAVDGRAVELDGAKQRTALAALLLAGGRLVPDERLTTLLWGWEPPATSTNQLYTYVSRLRTRLGAGHGLHRHGAGYRMDTAGTTVDWDRFRELADAGRADLRAARHAEAERRLADALALWRGPALGDVTEHLAAAEGPRLAEAHLAAVELHAEAALALGRHDELLPALTRHVTAHPVRERARAQLMTALFRAGRQADALAQYEQARRLLAEELGIDPGPELRALHQEILTGTLAGPAAPERTAVTVAPAAAAEEPAVSCAEEPAARPALLPAAPRDFTGRESELRFVLDALQDGRDVTVTGAPGTGKSALALYAAERARDAFPDGQLHADLRETDGTPRSPRQVLGWFLRALGTAPAHIPDGLDERAHRYRTLLAGRRMLVVLDNAADDAQVRPLLPGGGATRTLVTGLRPALAALEGARLVRLGPMSPAEAARLLASVAGPERLAADPESTARIAEYCDRLPLALRIAAARLADRPHWRPARLADRLAPAERRLGELRIGSLDITTALRPALAALDAPAARALAVLAAAGLAALTAADAAALLDLPLDDAEDVLERLCDARLLEPGSGADRPARYRMPALVGLLGRSAVLAA